MPSAPRVTPQTRANFRAGWDRINWTGTRPEYQGAVYRVAAKPLGTVIDVPKSAYVTKGTAIIKATRN